MKTTVRKPRWSGMAATVALLLMVASSALAATPTTTDHRNATQPMITGTAMLVNEHQLLVNTEQGEEVLLTLDTRTMVPTDLAAGMMMRVQFKYLDDGTRYAERVIPIRSGHRVTRELAYSTEREVVDSDEQLANYASTADMGATTAHARYGHRPVAVRASVTNQPLGTPLRPIPATDAYVVATQTMIAGQVATVNDHRIVVNTDQGHPVALEMDTRTLIPSDLQSGMGVRVEYKAMQNGTKLATRIVPIHYEGDVNHEMAYASTDQIVAQNEISTSSTSTETTLNGEPVAAATDETAATDQVVMNEGNLPQTASKQPLIALMALLALGAAGALAYRRRSHVG